jgi:hypothetical protein
MSVELNYLLIIDIKKVRVSLGFEKLLKNLRQHLERKAINLCNEGQKSTSDRVLKKGLFPLNYGKSSLFLQEHLMNLKRGLFSVLLFSKL